MVPLSFYFWQREKENLHYMHPGQILLHKMMYFELLYVAVGFIVMLLGETITLNCWDVEQACIWMLLLCNHVDQMALHYALGSQDRFSDAASHSGSKLTTKGSTIIVCIVLFVVTLLGWIYVGVSVWGVGAWSNFTNAGGFAFFHDMLTIRYLDYFIYSTCALVQVIKVLDFWIHYQASRNITSSASPSLNDRNNGKQTKSNQTGLLLINVVVAALAFLFIVIDMFLLARHAEVGNYFFNAYFIVMVFIQIPMLHYMIVKQSNSQQSVGGRAESWVVKDYDNALMASVSEK